MSIALRSSNRFCAVTRVNRFDQAAIRRKLLDGVGVQSGFTVLNTDLPAAEKTAFAVFDNGRQLLVTVYLRDLTGPGDRPAGPVRETVELFLNPWNDGLGYFHFAISADGGTSPVRLTCTPGNHTTFTPYEAAHSTAFEPLRLLNTRWVLPDWSRTGGSGRPADETETAGFLFAWFDAHAVFRLGNDVGFNVARAPGDDSVPQYGREYSSWNPCSGVGGPDATSFGRLYRNRPATWADDAGIERDDQGRLRITGRSASGVRPAFRLLDPLGNPVPRAVRRDGERWTVRLPPAPAVPGRYRLYAGDAGEALEPRYLAFDLPPDPAQPFTCSMTYDIPDDIGQHPLPYTPDVLAAELDLLRAHGISRIHWIDYPPETLYSRAGMGETSVLRKTRAACGDLLPLAASLAKARGLEFLGIFKPFDIAMDRGADAATGHTVASLENRRIWVPGDLARSQDSVQAVSPEWFPEEPDPRPARIRLYSRTPISAVNARDFALWFSDDNRHYHPYTGPLRVRRLCATRPHQRWTAAGNRSEPTGARRYVLELDGLRAPANYLAVSFPSGIRLTERAHALGEAWNAAGRLLPVILDRGSAFGPVPGRPMVSEHGFEFWRELNWINATPFMLTDVTVGPGIHGLVFALPRSQPTLLEPCCPGTRELWLDRVRRILETDADGVGIRTLCFHNRVMDHMRMAFGPAVLESFRAAFGREPEPDWADAVRVRELRGRAYTEFLRRAQALARQAGKRLALHLEAGIEVPQVCDQRLQFNLEWETWIRERIADEVLLKWWFAQNPFIHERVLPLARRHGIPVHIIDRNGSLKTPRAVERACALASESRLAGFSGLAWYEAAAWKRRNTANVPEFRAHAGDAIRQACLG